MTGVQTCALPIFIAAHKKLGDLYRQTGETDKAYREYEIAHKSTQERVIVQEGSDASRYNLALSSLDMAEVSRELKRDMEACRGYIDASITTLEEVLANPKPGLGAIPPFSVRYLLSDSHNRLAVHVLRLGNPGAALDYFRRSFDLNQTVAQTIDDAAQLANLDDKQKTKSLAEAARIKLILPQSNATALMAMGSMSFRLQRNEDAEAFFQQALDIREKVFADKPDDLGAKWNLSRLCGAVGDFNLQTGKHEAAEKFCQRSLTLIQQISDADPMRADFRRDLGMARYRLGLLQLRSENAEAARTHFEKCREVRQRLADVPTATPRQKLDWKLAQAHCGEHEEVARFLALIETEKAIDAELLTLIARAYATCSRVASVEEPLASRYRDKCFETLQKLLDTGYRDVVTLQMEPDFDPIRSDSRFAEIKLPSR